MSPGYSKFADNLLGKSTKRASSVSVLSGLGVQNPERALDPVTPTTPNSRSPSSPAAKKPSKLRNFFGQRPPSELITNHLTEYFPFTEKKLLERTARHSMMLRSGSLSANQRDSGLSFNNQLPSRFSNSSQGSQPRLSISSTISSNPPAVPDKSSLYSPDVATLMEDIPRMSLSTEDGRSVELNQPDDAAASPISMPPQLLPPVKFPTQSLAESMSNYTSVTDSRRVSRAMSNASKRMSYITELRSKRDRSDTASLMTVDEITAEVESRRESLDTEQDTDDWTKLENESDEEDLNTLVDTDVPNEVFEEDGDIDEPERPSQTG
jgi:mitogen-activated protein kinase kinase kinase